MNHLARHGLVRTDADGAATEADVGAIASGGTALFYVLDPKRREAIDAAVGELGEHVARRIEHDELVALGGDPRAAFALVAAPGHGFSDKRTREVIAAMPSHGTHGWPPGDPAMAASLIAFGPAVPHVALGTVEMIDIAPTIALAGSAAAGRDRRTDRTAGPGGRIPVRRNSSLGGCCPFCRKRCVARCSCDLGRRSPSSCWKLRIPCSHVATC